MSRLNDKLNKFYIQNCKSEVLKLKSTIANYGVIASSLDSIKSFLEEFSVNGKPLFSRGHIFSGKCSYENFNKLDLNKENHISHPLFSKKISDIIFKKAPEVINVEKVYTVTKAYEVIVEAQKVTSYPLQIPGFPVFNSALEHFNFNINRFSDFETDFPKESIDAKPYIEEIRIKLGGQHEDYTQGEL
jgi:hypothetical protein